MSPFLSLFLAISFFSSVRSQTDNDTSSTPPQRTSYYYPPLGGNFSKTPIVIIPKGMEPSRSDSFSGMNNEIQPYSPFLISRMQFAHRPHPKPIAGHLPHIIHQGQQHEVDYKKYKPFPKEPTNEQDDQTNNGQVVSSNNGSQAQQQYHQQNTQNGSQNGLQQNQTQPQIQSAFRYPFYNTHYPTLYRPMTPFPYPPTPPYRLPFAFNFPRLPRYPHVTYMMEGYYGIPQTQLTKPGIQQPTPPPVSNHQNQQTDSRFQYRPRSTDTLEESRQETSLLSSSEANDDLKKDSLVPVEQSTRSPQVDEFYERFQQLCIELKGYRCDSPFYKIPWVFKQ